MAETVKSIVEKLNDFYKQMEGEVTEEKELLEKGRLNDISHVILNKTLNMIIRNYELYKDNSEFITEDKYCKYLNSLLIRKKSYYDGGSSINTNPDFRGQIMDYLNRKKPEIYRNFLKCNILDDNYSYGSSVTRNKIDDLYYVREKLGGKEIIKRKKSICLDFNNYMYDTVCDIFKSVIPTNSDITLKKSDFARGINTHGNIFDIFTKISCEDERTLEDSGQFRDTKDQDNSLEIAGMQSDTCNCTYFTIFLSVIITFLGTVLTIFLLHKFSPIGSLLYNLIEKKGTIKKNIHDTEIENTLEDTFDSLHVNVKQKDYSMSYIPVEEY
ncbi:hypothetical protein, conserved [Plasmodium ovale]|uniref:PIR protein n=1 Tax=Plasmodium ovale TaxID=36330 RepID=A0A1C3KK73_PLAOA|nr:hypothetical protein, conserved [Plasmodium ovale]